MGNFKTGCLGAIALFIGLGVIGACMGPSGADKSSVTSTTSSTSSSTEKVEKKAPEYTCDVEGMGKVKGAVITLKNVIL